MLWTREGDSQQTFLDQDFGITTSTQFNSEIENAEDDFSTPLEATSTVIPTLYDLGTDIYLNTNEVFKMPLPNSFGLCEEVRNIKFGENINATRCTRYITYNTCDTDLNAEDYTGLTFSSKTGSTVAVTIGNTWVVTESDRAIDSSTLSAFATTTQSKSGTTCTCSKVLKEIHYTAIISSTYDEITSITADVVYYDLTAANCTNTLKFEQIYSFSFKGSEYARSQSGSSGYEYGYPVLIGDINTDDFIEAYETGFQLYGIDTSGE